MSENPEDEFLSKWREAWKTEEGKDRLMHFFRRIPRLPCPEPLLQWRPIVPEPEPKHDGYLDEEQLETLKDIRMELHIVGERLQNPLAALDALKSIDAKLKVLIEDAIKEQEDGPRKA